MKHTTQKLKFSKFSHRHAVYYTHSYHLRNTLNKTKSQETYNSISIICSVILRFYYYTSHAITLN